MKIANTKYVKYDNGKKSIWLAIGRDETGLNDITSIEDRAILIADDGLMLFKDDIEIGPSIWLTNTELSTEYIEKEPNPVLIQEEDTLNENKKR